MVSPFLAAIWSCSGRGLLTHTWTWPPPSAATRRQRRRHQVGADGVPGNTVMGVDHVLQGPAGWPPAHLGVADRVVMPRLERDQPCEALPTPLDQVQPLVLAEGVVAVGLGCQVEQLLHRGDVVGVHLSPDLDPMHAREAIGRPSALGPRLPLPWPGMARPRTPKGRTRETAARLAVGVPGHGQGAVRPRTRQPVPVAGRHHPVGPVDRRPGQHGHPGVVRPLPDRRGPGRGRPRRGGAACGARPGSSGPRPQPDRDGPGSGRALRRRGSRGHRGPDDAAGRGPQDGQRDPQRRLRCARASRRHPRVAAFPPARP